MKKSSVTVASVDPTLVVRVQQPMQKLEAGMAFGPRKFISASGGCIRIPDADRLVHLQFRRFAGCPVCTMHLNAFARRRDEIAAAGVHEVVFFYSTAEEIRKYTNGVPFDFVADPDRREYLRYDVHAAARALLDPRAWGPITKAVALNFAAILRGRPVPPLNPRGSRFGLPADILISPEGRVLASKYGAHVNDQWSVDQLLALVREYEQSAEGRAHKWAHKSPCTAYVALE
jgi:peroxiredoxin